MTCSPNHTKLKFIDLTKEIEDCSKDQSLSMYHYQSTNGQSGQTTHSGTQRKKINKRFRNNPGFASNFFFFPSSVAVNGNTSANMAIQKENSSSSSSTCSADSSSVTTTTPRRWSLHSKHDKMTAATPSEGAPAQDDKGNELLFNEETCHSFPTKKSPQSTSRGGKRNGKGRGPQRRFSCSDYLPSKSSLTEQDLASIDNIYSPMSSYCITPNTAQLVNFTFSSPDAPSQPSPPTTTSVSLESASSLSTTNNEDGEKRGYEEEWGFLDPNAKKRRPSFDLNQDEMDKLFHSFSFEPIQEFENALPSFSCRKFESEDSSVEESTHISPHGKSSEDQTMKDQAVDHENGYVQMLQDMPSDLNESQQTLTSDPELLFNSLPEEMKQQLVSFFLLQSNSQPVETANQQVSQSDDTEPKETEKRSTSTTQEIDNLLLENVSDQPLFEPITEIGLSELKEFGLFEELEEQTLKASNSNDDFESFLNNL